MDNPNQGGRGGGTHHRGRNLCSNPLTKIVYGSVPPFPFVANNTSFTFGPETKARAA